MRLELQGLVLSPARAMRATFASVLAIVLFVWVLPVGAAEPAYDAELVRLEQVWNEAHLKGDVAALEALWDDGLVVTVPKMPRMNRETAVNIARSGRVRFERYDTTGLETSVHGDVAVVTGQMERARRRDDQLLQDRWQFTKVYLRRDGRWRVVVFHASDAPDPG